MPNSNVNLQSNATIINIHSPNGSPEMNQPSIQPHQVPLKQSPKVEEYRKMIQHIMGKILKRKRPPTSLLYLPSQSADQFENEIQIDLLIKLRSALMVCHSVGLSSQVLTQGIRTPSATPISSKVNSPLPSPRMGSPSRSPENMASILPSAIQPKNDKRSEFEKILSALSDLISNDSRYKSANPKPSVPPFTMQSVLIDIGLILIQIQEDTIGLYNIGLTFLPAFEAFSSGPMLGKLLSLYLDSLLPKLIHQKDEHTPITENDTKRPSQKTLLTAHNKQNTPTISIQSPDQDTATGSALKMSHLTIDTRLQATNTDGFTALPSPYNTNHHQPESHYTYALFTPLLLFMMEYLDPYLMSNEKEKESLDYTLTKQANSIRSFHRALGYMMYYKPDIYLDILDIISHSTNSVRYRACQTLFYYYSNCVGHALITNPVSLMSTEEEIEALDKRRKEQITDQDNQAEPRVSDTYRRLQKQQATTQPEPMDTAEDHTWYPHLFEQTKEIESKHPAGGGFEVHDDFEEAFCKECFKPIKGFGLRCYQCRASLHYHCSHATLKEEQGLMFYLKAGGIQKVVTPHFCSIRPEARFRQMVNLGVAHWNVKSNATRVGLMGHLFDLVNLFTLTTCASCHLPIWGITHQCYHCSLCNHFIHPHCLSKAEENGKGFEKCLPGRFLVESDLCVGAADLSKSLREFYDDALPLKAKDLKGRSFEEVGTIYNILLLQNNIIHCGVAAGCILISDDGEDPLILQKENADSFKNRVPYDTGSCSLLSSSIDVCWDYLTSSQCKRSAFFTDFYKQSSQVKECVLSQESYLSHLSVMMKSLTTLFGESYAPSSPTGYYHSSPPALDKRRSAGDSRGFLQVNSMPAWEQDEDSLDQDQTPHEQLDRFLLLSWMMTNLSFKSRKVAEMLLQHMRNLGLFERLDGSPVVFRTDEVSSANQEESNPVACLFPIPSAIPNSFKVDTTINAIEACLHNVDLSINECGLLLLVRRCWPDPFMSSYTHERLIYAILQWTFDEDERLLALHAELTSGNSNVNKQQTKWAQTAFARKIKGEMSNRHRQSALYHTAGVSSGASTIYVATRTALKDRYIAYWMAAIHDMDKQVYADMLYNAIQSILDSKNEACLVPDWNEDFDRKKYVVQKYEQFVSYILKLKTYELVFGVLDSLIQKWFDQAYEEFNKLGILQDKEPVEIRHLAKLCSTKLKATQTSRVEKIGSAIDILVTQFSDGSKDSIERGMRWLELVVHAGAGVPSKILIQITTLIISAHAPLDVITKFVKIVWFQIVNVLNAPVVRGDVIEIMGHLHEATFDSLIMHNQSSNECLFNAQVYIRYSVAITAYAFGCSLSQISTLDIVPSISNVVSHLPQSKRNTLHANNATVTQPDEKLPIFHCILKYLNYNHLNANECIIKLFYSLSHWGQAIVNRDEFLSNCMPQLMPNIWKNLTPSFDYLSSVNLDLLMRLINVNAGYFRSYIQNIFENDCWENRYQGLDNLYGLFSKMDAEFQTEWLKLLCHLGPAFSYLVQSLWDKEEYVRSKAFAIMRAFTTLHLRSAFRCWEAYFLTATEEQKVPLLRQMIQLNALFPDWQVLQWESLLEALEPGLYMDLIDKHAQPPVTYDLLKDDDETLQTVESQNIKLLMITLAMQMLSNHLSIAQNQVYRLKFILIQQMGFQNCHYFNDGGDIIIDFGPLRYNSENIAQIASMMSCVRGLKKVMDSFAPLPAETVAVMASQSVEHSKLHLSENTSPGVYFIDVVFKMINSGIDLTQLGHMVLKGWLETFLIVIYKHNILDSECERDIVNSMKVVIGLLTSNISEENKLLILEILKCLLRRSDHLTAMVLSKQIMALGKLLTKHGLRHSDPVLLKAKQFLKSAFLRFAVAGLFVLLFKNQSTSDSNNKEMDLFFVLRTVIDPEDTIPDEDIHGEPVYLYDQPVRDVLDKLMKQQMDRKAFSNVLSNTSRYVETVHSHPYSLSVLNELPSFLNALTKHTADWRRSDWDINPVLIMSARLLKEHPYQYSSLISPIQTVFKHGLQHCVVQPKTAAKLLASYSSVVLIPGVSSENPFANVILEETKNCLSSVNRPSKETMQMLLQVIFWDLKPTGQKWYMEIEKTTTDETRERTRYFQNKIESLLPHLVNFLKLSSTSQQFTKKDFKIYNIASHLVAYQCSKDASQVANVLGLLKLEETPECLRFLNWFGLVLLSENLNVLLLKMLDYESIIVDLLVQTLYNVKIDFHTPDLSFSYNRSNEVLLLCFVLLRTWALLKIRCRSIGDLQDMNQTSFWFTVWPALRRLLEMVELSTLLSPGSVGISIWNMFLSLLQFLFVARSEAVIVNEYEWNSLLEDLLEKLDEIGNSIFMQEEQEAERVVFIANFKRRIAKTKSMFDTPPFEVPENTLINQLLLELRDVMRLEAESVVMQGNSRILTQNGASI